MNLFILSRPFPKVLLYGGVLSLFFVCMVAPLSYAQIPSLPGTGGAQGTEEETDEEAAPSVEDSHESLMIDLESRIADVEALIAENQILEETGVEDEYRAIPLETVQARTAAYRKLLMAYQRHRNALRDLIALEEQHETFDAEREDALAIEEEPPYTIAFLDGLLDEVSVRQMDVEAEVLSLRALRELVSMARADISGARTTLNRMSEQLRGASQADRPRLLYEVETARVLVTANEAEYDAARMELRRTETYRALLEKNLELARERVERARAQTLFRQEELDTIIERQGTVLEELAEEGRKARDAIEQHRTRIAQAERAVERAGDEEAALYRAREDIDLHRRRMEASRIELAIIESLQEYENDVIELWQMRFWTANPSLAPEWPDWNALASQLRDRIDLYARERTAGDRRAMSLRIQVSALESRLANWTADDGDRGPVEQQLTILRGRETVRTRIQVRMSQITNLAERVLDEVRMRQLERSWIERVTDGVTRVYTVISMNLDREITEIGDESITIRKIFYMLVILVGGLVVGRFLIRYLRGYAAKKLKLRSNVVLIIEKLSNYLLFIIVFYFALNYVNIPLTIFTFLGGAIALGIGFGAQNLINNFLCGLILMGEQPIRIGDWVDIDGKTGIITNIGARASRLRLFSGVDVLIPNSKFLENNVVNWTLSDKKVRLQISVGVAYGSPTREAQRLIMRAVSEHGVVLEDPEPKVFFEDFGDSALVFSAYLWVEIGPATDARTVMSDIRHRIDKLFREADIVIAFPQRDIHLDTTAPLDVRILSAEKEDDAPEENDSPMGRLP